MPLPAPKSQLALAARAGFTLIEIILAIGLGTALLLIALTFYHQAAETRSQILRESEEFSTMRLVLDRMAGDLRAVQPVAASGNEFTGDSNSMSFVKLAFTYLPPNSPPGTSEPTDLLRISFSTMFGTNGTNIAVSGLDRTEEPLNAPAVNPTQSTNLIIDLSLNTLDDTNQVREPLAGMVRFVRFRYWDGAAWQPAWTNASPPPGVEIILARERPAENAEPDAFPPESFRRVIYVPGGVPHPAPDTNGSTSFALR